MKNLKGLLFSVLMLTMAPVFAGAGHDHGPKHGGVVREVSSITYELVARSDSLTLYVHDHGKPVSTEGAKAVVTLYAGSEKTGVALEPAGDNRMAAKGSFKVGVGVRATLSVTLAGKPEVRANYNLR